MNDEHGLAAYAVLRQVRPLHLQAARAVTAVLADQPITMAIRALLERLHETGPQTVPQIAAWLDVSRQAVQRVVDDARALGHVEVRNNPTHRRSHLIALTSSGRRAFEQLHADEIATLARLAADIDPRDLLVCATVLEQLTARIARRADQDPRRGH